MRLLDKLFHAHSRPVKLSRLEFVPFYVRQKLERLHLVDGSDPATLTDYLWKVEAELHLPIGDDTDNSRYYLLVGRVNYPEYDYELHDSNPQSCYPLDVAFNQAHGKMVFYENNIILRLPETVCRPVNLASPEDIDYDGLKHDYPQLKEFFNCIHDDRLIIPSIPDAAMELQQLMTDTCNIDDMVRLVELNSDVVEKLLHTANSALYCHLNPVVSCKDAVRRLGMTATRSLLLSIYLRQVFQCNNKDLTQRVKKVWHHGLYFSNYLYALAKLNEYHKPKDALLVGLLDDVGSIPLLAFLACLPECEVNKIDVDKLLKALIKPVTAKVLQKWGISDEVRAAVLAQQAWYAVDSSELSLLDLTNLSKLGLEMDMGTNRTGVPLIWTLPAFKKLLHQDIQGMSLECFNSARRLSVEIISAYDL